MILYPKGNSMFLNTFPTIFWCQNHFYDLSASRNHIVHNHNTKNHVKKHVFFRDFLVNNFDFETLRGRKIDFDTEKMLERVQKHLITLGIQYHDLRTSIGTYIVGNAKNTVKKEDRKSVV